MRSCWRIARSTRRPIACPAARSGLAWFAIDPAAHRLDIALNAPAKARPREKLTLPIQIAGLGAGEEAYVTVAAVDIGILNLTHYQTPDPREHFFGQRMLSTEIRDIYGLLIDGLQGARGQIRSGGDGGGPETSAEKPTQEPLALYSGIVRVGAGGKAEVDFDLPAFNGSVRVDGGRLVERAGPVRPAPTSSCAIPSWSRPACRVSSRSMTSRGSICASTMSKAPPATTS